MVAVDSPYSVLPKGCPGSETRPHLSRFGVASREPWSEQESLPTISNLGSWNGLLAHLPAGFISATASRARAEELRRTHFRPCLPRSSCIIPGASRALGPDGSVPAPFRRTVQPFDFPEISLFPLRASASRAAFQGLCPPAAHALRARNSFKYIAQPNSVQALPALTPGALFHSEERRAPSLFAENSPPESRWATSPPRKMALGPLQASHWPPKCPVRSGPAGCASLIEVSNHRRTFAALLRVTAQGANTLDRAIVVPNLITRQMLTNS